MMNSPGSVAVNIKLDAKFRVHRATELLFCFPQELARWNDFQFKKELSFGPNITEKGWEDTCMYIIML
jgi:hypothetical protein